MTYVGIDPGNSGAVALMLTEKPAERDDCNVYPHGSGWVALAKLQTEKLKNSNVLNGRWLFSFLSSVRSFEEDCFAGVEHQHARIIIRGGQRRLDKPSTAFSLGYGYGVITQTLVCAGIPFQSFSPQSWQSGLGVGADKEAAFGMCHRLFPDVSLVPIHGRVEHDGLADALLICEYARRVHSGRT